MGSQALAGKFVVLFQGNSVPPQTPTAWTEVEEVFEIGEINVNRAMYDATSHGSSIYRDRIPGVADAIDVVCSLNYIKDQFLDLRTLMSDGTLQWWRVEYPDQTRHEFEAYVSQVSTLQPLDERITYTITLAVTQDETFTF